MMNNDSEEQKIWLFTLPFPVSANAVWRKFQNRMVLSPRSKGYRLMVEQTMKELGYANLNITKPVEVFIGLYPPTKRKYDVDNYFKSLNDALTACNFWADDEQIVRITAVKQQVIKGGGVSVIVTVHD